MEQSQEIAGCIIVSGVDVQSMLAQESKEGKRELEPLKSFSRQTHIPLNILEDTNVTSEFEVHTHMGDLWHCIEGEVIFTLGGQMVNPKPKVGKDGTLDEREIRAVSVEGGTERVLKTGDWLWIPPGIPHAHRTLFTARLYVVKIPR